MRVVRAGQPIEAERPLDASERAGHSSTAWIKPLQSWAIACDNSTSFAARSSAPENVMRNSPGVSRMAAGRSPKRRRAAISRRVRASAAAGCSFGGVADYCLHDRLVPGEAHPERAERVEWTETRNVATNHGERAARIMAATAEAGPELKRLAGEAATGRKLEKPVCIGQYQTPSTGTSCSHARIDRPRRCRPAREPPPRARTHSRDEPYRDATRPACRWAEETT